MQTIRPTLYLSLALMIALITPNHARGDVIVPVSGSTTDQIGFGNIANVIDGVINFDSYLRLGPPDYTPFQGPYSVIFDLGGRFNLTAMNLWNNAGVIDFDGEGIDSFTLRFLDNTSGELGTFSDNAVDTLSEQAFSFTVEDVSSVELVINSNHDPINRAYADFYEIHFTGTAVPEPSSWLLVGIGVIGVARSCRHRVRATASRLTPNEALHPTPPKVCSLASAHRVFSLTLQPVDGGVG